jgi:formylglycine-generating enzyme required for sulfatase activity
MRKLIFIEVFAFIGLLAFAQERIAVFPFEDLDNIFTQNESLMFYRRFSNEFVNRNSDRFTIVPRLDVERLINTEAKFQLTEFSAREKTAEMERVLNGTRILSGIIAKNGTQITISISLYTYPDLEQLPGGVDLDVANKNELSAKVPVLVQMMMTAMTGGGGTGTGTNTGGGTTPVNFVRVEGGTFTMGSHRSGETQHQVTISAFYMGKYEVTQAEYESVMRTNPSYFKGANLPVECVNWYDAIEYCNRLSQREGLTPAYIIDKNRSDPNNKDEYDTVCWLVTWNRYANGYRLPTEAEWEYACRAGTTTEFNTGNNIGQGLANYGKFYNESTTAVGRFAPNTWGLYDMHGNIWEWCWDWYGDYSSNLQTDPMGAASGTSRVVRGGSWATADYFTSSSMRASYTPIPGGDDYLLGFRLVRN